MRHNKFRPLVHADRPPRVGTPLGTPCRAISKCYRAALRRAIAGVTEGTGVLSLGGDAGTQVLGLCRRALVGGRWHSPRVIGPSVNS